jgi:tetratricopeptide (TPR) repeat protein
MLDRLAVIAVAASVIVAAPCAAPARARTRVPPPTLPAPPPTPAEVVAKAHALRDDGRPAEAETVLRAALEAAPEDVPLLAELGEALSDQGRDDEAIQSYEKIVSVDPDAVGPRLRLADLYLYTDRPDAALEHYLQVQAARPGDPALRRKVADILLSMDRTADAVPHLVAYLDAVPGDIEARRTLYKAYLWTDQTAQAIETLKTIVDTHPEDLDASRELAERYVDQSDEASAIALYERILEARPDDAVSRRALGELYEWNDAPSKALDQYEAFLQTTPYDSEIRGRAMQLAVDLGLGGRAKRHAEVLGMADPRSRDLARDLMLVDTGFGTSLAAEYWFFSDSDDFFHHAVGPRFRYGFGDEYGVGAKYTFHWLNGPDAGASPVIMGHQGELFADARLPWDILLEGAVAVTWYDTNWTSINALLSLTKDFADGSIRLFGERIDWLTTAGDVRNEVVGNGAGLELGWEFWYPLFVTVGGEYTYLQSPSLGGNHRGLVEGGFGVIAYPNPRIEVAYQYNIEMYDRTDPTFSYFARDHYQSHGPMASIRHPVTHWFLYGADLHLWHVVEDSTSTHPTLLLTYGAELVFRPGVQHLIRAAYHRTDTLSGFASSVYRENVLTASYTFEF